MLEVQPFAGEEMDLPSTNVRRDGFLEGERTLAAQILAVLDDDEHEKVEPLELEMVLGR